jgi:hypothetical protein
MDRSSGRPQKKPQQIKKFKIILSIFSDHNATKLEDNNKKNFINYTNTQKLNSIFLNNQWINEEMKKDIKKAFDT